MNNKERWKRYHNDYEELRYKLDPQEAPVSLYCDICGGEIYDGETYYSTLDSGDICEKCLEEQEEAHRRDCERIAGDIWE